MHCHRKHYLPSGVQAAVLAGVGGICKLFMAGLAHTRLTGGEILEAALKRPPGQALITISNHVAAMDDPLVLAAALPMRALGDPAALRWTMCATDRCFKHAALSTFFRAGKVHVPLLWGDGLTGTRLQHSMHSFNALPDYSGSGSMKWGRCKG